MPADDQKLFIPVPVPAQLLAAARSLRRTMTDAEKLLWHCLRHRQLGGYRFRKQHPIENFIIDFYCCGSKLAVELDGGQHHKPDARVYDAERSIVLGARGIKVLRFWNNEVLANTEGVLQTIYDELLRRSPPSPPPPAGGR